MSKENEYIKTINKLIRGVAGSPMDMADLAFTLHKGIAVLILMIEDDHQEKLLSEVVPLIREYMEEMKNKHPELKQAVFKA
jgi:hypothetical protein